jgi:alpha-mannosidase
MPPRLLLLLVAALVPLALRAAAPPAADPTAFCREVLILHHSHVDVGYTHPQSMYWELQKNYLDAALDLLDRTEAWPDDLSRPRWTAEATAPLMRWLETAPARDVARLKHHLKTGRFGISGFEYNTTPLCTAEGLARQLYHVRTLRRELGADIRTVNQHDVTGIPWTAVDLLIDSRIELLIMAINLHLGGTPMPRPAVYRWKGPSGRELLVMNGEHYSMFDQWTEPASRDLDAIQAGLRRYLTHVHGLGYPHDFVYLTATCAPFMYDNSPPNQELPDLVRQWNEEGRQPRLRLVTPVELLERLQRIPRESIPVVTGDWTDYWNFGSGSSAVETRLVRQTTANAAAIDLLRTAQPDDPQTATAVGRIWYDIHLYNEHTWGAYNTLEADHPFVVTQWHLKSAPAYDGKPLSEFHLRRQLHRLAGNPWQSRQTPGVLVVNPSGLRQDYFVPGTWAGEGRRIEAAYLAAPREATARPLTDLRGPVRLEPYSWQILPWSDAPPRPARRFHPYQRRHDGNRVPPPHLRSDSPAASPPCSTRSSDARSLPPTPPGASSNWSTNAPPTANAPPSTSAASKANATVAPVGNPTGPPPAPA